AQDESDADASAGEAQALAPEPVDRSALPNQELTENLLYELLLAEIAGQRGNAALSAQAYVDLAKRTRDPRIARRATEVALYARMNNAAIESATVWHETEPGATNALRSRKPARPGSCGRSGTRPSCSKRNCCRRSRWIRPRRCLPPI